MALQAGSFFLYDSISQLDDSAGSLNQLQVVRNDDNGRAFLGSSTTKQLAKERPSVVPGVSSGVESEDTIRRRVRAP